MRSVVARASALSSLRQRSCLMRGNAHRTRHIVSSQRLKHSKRVFNSKSVAVVIGALLISSLYPADHSSQHSNLRDHGASSPAASSAEDTAPNKDKDSNENAKGDGGSEKSAWSNFTSRFESLTFATDLEWSKIPDKVADLILPDWGKLLPGFIRKLQKELSLAPGSLADDIWKEAGDPAINPEIPFSARVRVSEELCEEEKTFLERRKKIVAVALAKYLGLPEDEVHHEDVPTIAVCGSGGGLRALVAGTGSLLATAEDGLFDCVTYTSGVSGSCWLQTLYNSSVTNGSLPRTIDHLKARLGVHIAYPPTALGSLVTAPTNKPLLSGIVEKLQGDPKADFGLVDVYGLLLAARLLVPKGELGVNDRDFKLSNQQEYIRYGQSPLPIYTAVRHEIPSLDETGSATEAEKEEAKKEAWFQWFEMTPYEFFCEEFSAGIPTWALGRKFKCGADVPVDEENGLYLPETRMPLLMGIFGSAFCATMSHYYREIRPVVQSIAGFQAVDDMISGRNEDLSKVHPIDPALLPNFAYGMHGRLPNTTPKSIYDNEYIQLMDAGMSNNLPIYPLLRPGRDVEVIIAFDASADVKTDNWLAVAEGYAKQRGVIGWPVGIGWPKDGESPAQVAKELKEAQADSAAEARSKMEEAQADQAAQRDEAAGNETGVSAEKEESKGLKQKEETEKFRPGDESAGELGYCNVWVGSKQERSSEPPPPSKALDHMDEQQWSQIKDRNAGLAVVYMPFLSNEERVPGVDPAKSEYMSTWNFVYSSEQIDGVVALAKANFDEGKERIRATIRAVYERKKAIREATEAKMKHERYRRLVRSGMASKLGEGDHFS